MPDVMIFDGTCNLCSSSVQFVLKYESSPTLYFASVQSPTGSRLMHQYGLDPTNVQTFVLIESNNVYVRSEAAMRVARHLRMPWRAVRVLDILPRTLLDWSYDLIARNRYRWFGQHDLCSIPSPSHAKRFLD
ncbi:MAG TPA: thiol-disulfide oxidoreductase DCC family protein [Cellvibrionaceae bacterium]